MSETENTTETAADEYAPASLDPASGSTPGPIGGLIEAQDVPSLPDVPYAGGDDEADAPAANEADAPAETATPDPVPAETETVEVLAPKRGK